MSRNPRRTTTNHTNYTNEKTADHADSADKTVSVFTILEKEIGG
jgi:hypothetical protein